MYYALHFVAHPYEPSRRSDDQLNREGNSGSRESSGWTGIWNLYSGSDFVWAKALCSEVDIPGGTRSPAGTRFECTHCGARGPCAFQTRGRPLLHGRNGHPLTHILCRSARSNHGRREVFAPSSGHPKTQVFSPRPCFNTGALTGGLKFYCENFVIMHVLRHTTIEIVVGCKTTTYRFSAIPYRSRYGYFSCTPLPHQVRHIAAMVSNQTGNRIRLPCRPQTEVRRAADREGKGLFRVVTKRNVHTSGTAS